MKKRTVKSKTTKFAIITLMWVLMTCMSIFVSGCSNGDEDYLTDLPEETPYVETAYSTVPENAVEEFEEDKLVFEPAELRCTIPLGFSETENPGEYLYRTYPKDVSNINRIINESDTDLSAMSVKEFADMVNKEYNDAYEENVSINVTQYDRIVVDGRPGRWAMYDFDFRGDHYEVLMVILYNGDKSDIVTYMQGPGAHWMKRFVESANSLHYSVPGEEEKQTDEG